MPQGTIRANGQVQNTCCFDCDWNWDGDDKTCCGNVNHDHIIAINDKNIGGTCCLDDYCGERSDCLCPATDAGGRNWIEYDMCGIWRQKECKCPDLTRNCKGCPVNYGSDDEPVYMKEPLLLEWDFGCPGQGMLCADSGDSCCCDCGDRADGYCDTFI